MGLRGGRAASHQGLVGSVEADQMGQKIVVAEFETLASAFCCRLSGASGKSRQLSPTVRCPAGDVADGAVADPIRKDVDGHSSKLWPP